MNTLTRCLMALFVYILPLPTLFAAATSPPAPPSPEQRYQTLFKERAIQFKSIEDLQPLLRAIGDRRWVLMGESTHGTQEFYHWRDQLSRQLIAGQGFRFVAVEGDWQAISRLNDYVKWRTPEGLTAEGAMRTQLTRWPQWMWANRPFGEFVEWLRQYNAELPEAERVGLYGLDMQDPRDSMEQVLNWFREHDPKGLRNAEAAYQRILDFPEDFRGYARHLMRGGPRLHDALAAVVQLLRDHMGDAPPARADKSLWAAKQNALAVKRAEAQFFGATLDGPESWNARASYMHEALMRISERFGPQSRGIVWAHNTHIGDARATDMRARGEVNIGQLVRQHQGEQSVLLLGFAKYRGEVVAGSNWGVDQRVMRVPPARAGSYEALLHKAVPDQALLMFDDAVRGDDWLTAMPQRAIGVIYRPPHEAYVPTLLTHRYDALLYFKDTQALAVFAD